MVEIRPFTEADWPAVWRILEPVFRAGETYPQSPEISESDARRFWVEVPAATYVALGADGQPVATYYVKHNQPTLGDHVCNCGYAVAEDLRGRGVGSRLCAHSLEAAASLGFRAMQFNLVVSTNEPALRIYRRHGFEVVGTLTGAFRHPRLGEIDAYVLYRRLG